MCVFVCPLRLFPATPGWGVWWVCVCSGSGFGCAPPILAEVLGCVCVRVPAPVVPRHSWLGCVVWFFCLSSGFSCASPLLAGVLGCVCVCVPAPYVPRHSWLGWAVWVCMLGLGFSAAPRQSWLGLLGCVCVCVRAPPVTRHSWLGCVVWMCVLGLGFRLRPATPGGGVGVCVCLCAHSACTPPLLAGVCGVGVCIGCCLAPVSVPWLVACCARCPGLRHSVAVVAWHLFVCCVLCRRRPSLACLVAHGWCAAPHPFWSLPVLRSALSTPWCLDPFRGVARPDLLGGCAGHVEAGRERGSLCLPLAPAEAGALGSLRVVPVRGPAMGLSLAGSSGVGLGLRALRWLACVDPVTDASSFPYRSSFDGGLSRCTGAFSRGRQHLPLRVGGRHARVPHVCACACFAWLGWAGRPPGRVLVRLTFSCGRFVLFLCSACSRLGSPCLLCVFFFPFVRPCCLWRSVFSGRGSLGPWRLVRPPLFFLPPPPSPLFSFLLLGVLFLAIFFLLLLCLLFFFFAGCAVLCRFVLFWLLGVLLCGAVGAAVCGALCVLPGAVWRACAWLGLRALLSGAVLRLVLLGCLCCVLLSCAAVFSAGVFFALFRAFLWWSLLFWSVWCSAVCSAVWRGPVAFRSCAGLWCAVPCGALPCRGAFLCSVLCCLFRCGAWVLSCLVLCCGVLLCSVCPWARCRVVLPCCLWSACCCLLCRVSGCLLFRGASCVVLCWCACVVALCAVLSRPSGAGWCCVLFPVVFGCVLLGLAVLCCLLVAPGVVFCWCCPCLAVWFGVSPPCGLVWCVWVLCSAVLCSVVLCCHVVVCCRTLLSVCVVACACCLFSGAALSAVCVLVCFPVVGRLVVAPCSPVLCPVVLCCCLVLRCRVPVSVRGAVCACRRFFPLKPLQTALKKIFF